MERLDPVLDTIADSRLRRRTRTAARPALTGGHIVRSLFGQPHEVRKKGAIDLVTEADVAAESAILASLEEDAPGAAVLAEESAGDHPTPPGAEAWIVDPLDGTTNFAHGLPLCAVSVAFWDGERVTAAAIHCPMQDELFVAAAGHGAFLDGRPIRVSERRFLVESLVATGFPYDIHRFRDEVISQLDRLLPKVRDVRRMGAAALDLAYVACGRLDGFWEMALKPWDTAAGALLVQEAGGRVSRFDGSGPYSPFDAEILASNGLVHDLLARELA